MYQKRAKFVFQKRVKFVSQKFKKMRKFTFFYTSLLKSPRTFSCKFTFTERTSNEKVTFHLTRSRGKPKRR